MFARGGAGNPDARLIDSDALLDLVDGAWAVLAEHQQADVVGLRHHQIVGQPLLADGLHLREVPMLRLTVVVHEQSLDQFGRQRRRHLLGAGVLPVFQVVLAGLARSLFPLVVRTRSSFCRQRSTDTRCHELHPPARWY